MSVDMADPPALAATLAAYALGPALGDLASLNQAHNPPNMSMNTRGRLPFSTLNGERGGFVMLEYVCLCGR